MAAGDIEVTWAIEGCRHYGLGLTRFLYKHNQHVVDIDKSRRISKRRIGKSDPIDAVRAATELLARDHHTTPRADGDREALRMLMVDRNHAVEARKTARSTLMSLLVTAPADLREHLRGLSQRHRPRVCAGLEAPATADRATRVLYHSLARLGRRILTLGAEIEQLTTEITRIVSDLAPGWSSPNRAWARSARPRYCCPGRMPGASAPKPPLPCSPGSHRSPPRPGAPPATASIDSAIANSIAPAHRRSQPDARPPTHPRLRRPPPREQD